MSNSVTNQKTRSREGLALYPGSGTKQGRLPGGQAIVYKAVLLFILNVVTVINWKCQVLSPIPSGSSSSAFFRSSSASSSLFRFSFTTPLLKRALIFLGSSFNTWMRDKRDDQLFSVVGDHLRLTRNWVANNPPSPRRAWIRSPWKQK